MNRHASPDRGGSGRERRRAAAMEFPFSVRRLAAGRLRFDFRLAESRRLAIRVDEHPLRHSGDPRPGPADRGFWAPEGDVPGALRLGRLAFTLRSDRLAGRFVLVRFETSRGRSGRRYWALRELAGLPPPTAGGPRGRRRPRAVPRPAGAVPAPLPSGIRPELATVVDRAPAGDDWIHEIRRDGLRVVATVDRGAVRLVGAGREDWAGRLGVLSRELASIPARTFILDGNVVALTVQGTSSRGLLRESLEEGLEDRLFYFVSDLLYLDGSDLRPARLVDRKLALARLLRGSPDAAHVRYSDHVRGRGELVYRHACDLSLEGVVSKRGDSPYCAGRGGDWLTATCRAPSPPAAAIPFPLPAMSEGELAAYYEEVAPWILPHVRGRLLSVVLRPGSEKAASLTGGLRVDDAGDLLALVRFGRALELRPWASRVEDLGHPDRCVLGLVPGRGVPWEAVVRAARDLREYLARAGLTCFLKTAAAGGLHVVVPLSDAPDWSRLRAFARRVADGFARLRPECVAPSAAPGPRPGRILIDAPRKEEGSASVAPYSAVAEGRGIVSTPLGWDECTPRLRPESFTLRSLPHRLRRGRVDPWAGIDEIRQAIPPGI